MLPTFDDSLKVLVKQLTDQKISIFCGAGISYNSGLPVAYQFIEAVLTKFGLTPEEKTAIHSSEFPFEAFIELLQKECRTDELLTIFKKGHFNTNHLFIAHLIKTEKVQNIITTNFDEHIEHACSSLGLIEGVDFKVYRNEKEFEHIEWADGYVKLIKIHGCVSDLDSMAINMRMVANKTESANKNAVVHHFFNLNINPLVLILGYSCSDVFDISPAIENIKGGFSEIILLEHVLNKEDQKSENLNFQPKKNPFKAFPSGTRLFFPTDEFIEVLWNSIPLRDYRLIVRDKADWETNINDWYKYVTDTNTRAFKHHISSRLFYDIGEYDFSEAHYNSGIAIAYELGEYKTAASEVGNLGLNFNALGRYNNAKNCLNTSLDIYRRIGDIEGEIIHLQSLGNVYRNEGNYELAEKNLLLSIKLCTPHTDAQHLCTALGNLALVYNLTGNYKKAIECAENGKLIGDKFGIKQSEGSQMASIAMAYYQTGNTREAIDLLIESIKIMRQIKDRRNESGALSNLASIYTQEGDIQKSMECLFEALPIAKKLGVIQFEGLIYFNMGQNYLFIGNKENALLYFRQALKIFQDIYPENHPHLKAALRIITDLNK